MKPAVAHVLPLSLMIVTHAVVALAQIDPPTSGRASTAHGFNEFDRPPEVPDDPYLPNVGPGQRLLASPAARWVRAGFESIQVNVNSMGENIVGDAANEPSIAIDPTDPNTIVIGWRQFDNIASNFRQAGVAYSHNGGQSIVVFHDCRQVLI